MTLKIATIILGAMFLAMVQPSYASPDGSGVMEPEGGKLPILKDIIALVKKLATPDTNPEVFQRIRRSPAWEHREDKTVWEPDTSKHGGDKFKVWPDRNSWERGDKPASFWPDGRLRKEP